MTAKIIAAGIMTGLAHGTIAAEAGAGTARPPNIVLILCDDLGYGDCSCYGQKTWTTPNIDRLAREGVRFTDFYTTSPVCSPARASILSGLHSGHVPIRSLKDPYLPDDVPTIPWLLKPRGYVSACVGKYGVGSGQPDVDPLRKGFDYHYGYNCMRHAHNYFPPFLRENGLRVPLRNRPPDGDAAQRETGVGVAAEKLDYSPDVIEKRALEFIRDCKSRPFFLYYCPTLPHANNEGGTTPDGMEVDTYSDFADRDWSPNEKGFARMVQRIDQTVGRVLDTLDEQGLATNTLVIFTSDNGPHNEGGHSVTRFDSAGGFQGYKRSLHEGGIRIPFIARWPGTVKPGISEHIGYFPDLMPTLCELAGAKAPSGDGLSFLPLLTGKPQPKHKFLYFEFENQLAVRKGNWKYFRYQRNKTPFSPDAPDGNEALFDLSTDSHEDKDLKTAHPEVLAELKKCVQREHRDYAPIPAPPGYDHLADEISP
jgi:arylsulfatase A-like enzyme